MNREQQLPSPAKVSSTKEKPLYICEASPPACGKKHLMLQIQIVNIEQIL